MSKREKQARRELQQRERRRAAVGEATPDEAIDSLGDGEPVRGDVTPACSSQGGEAGGDGHEAGGSESAEAGLEQGLLVVSPVDGADPEEVVRGALYWEFAEVNAHGAPVWAQPVSEIPGGNARLAGVCAVRATVPGTVCARCGDVLTLTSRAAFARVLDGVSDELCVGCSPEASTLIQRQSSPAAKARRDAHRAADAARARQVRAKADWDQACIDVVGNAYPLDLQPGADVPEAGVREEVLALALLRYAPGPAPFAALESWPAPLVRGGIQAAADAVNALRDVGLVRVHPDTDPGAFVWKQTFEEAVAAAGDDTGVLPAPELGDRYRPTRCTLYVPFGPSVGTAAERLDAHLTARLSPAAMDADRQGELLTLMVDVISNETLEYFDAELAKYNLPEVPENHRARLKEAASKGAAVRSLGEMYSLAWRAAKSAAAAQQEHLRAPAANMTIHAVNLFETHVQRATSTPWDIKPFGATSVGLSAMARVLFLGVLDADPYAANAIEIAERLPTPTSAALNGPAVAVVLGERELLLRCDACAALVDDGEGHLWVSFADVGAQRAEWAAWEAQGDAVDGASFIFGQPDSPRWRVHHHECDPDPDANAYSIEAHRLRTWADLTRWTAHLMGKKWLAGTNWDEVLEAAAHNLGGGVIAAKPPVVHF